MTDLKKGVTFALCALIITAGEAAADSGTLGNPEVKARWETWSPPPVELVSATVISCRPSVSPRRISADAVLVEDAVLGPLPAGDWCDLRLVVEGDDGARQILLIDITALHDTAQGILWIGGDAVGSLSAEVEALGG